MARIIKILAGVSAFAFLAFLIAYQVWEAGVLLTLCITFGTIAYHFVMRLGVGATVNGIFHNKMNYNKWWFRPRRFEKRLYGFLRVKRWKKFVPTYDPDTFSAKEHTFEELVQATCQAEVVHEIIVVLSFAPILFAIPFGALGVFLITSVLSAALDTVFVILQRYNRPRLVRVLKEGIREIYNHNSGAMSVCAIGTDSLE